MVWGVVFSTGFGDYFPGGDFDSFEESLRKHFESMPLDEQALYIRPNGVNSYVSTVFEKFIKDPNSEFSGTDSPSRIAEHEWPTEFSLRKRYATLGSLIKLSNRVLAVDEALKAIIERLEPDVHQFRRIIITMPRGTIYQVPYYTMVIGRFFDSFSPEISATESWRPTGYSGEPKHFRYDLKYFEKKHVVGLAFNRSVFGNSHLWREDCFRSAAISISNTLHDEIAKAGLRLPKHYQMREV